MLKLKSTTNTTPQSQNPNSLNPNCDHPLEDPLYFDIANYLVFDEDFGSNHNISCEKSQGVVDCSNGSFTSPPFANNMLVFPFVLMPFFLILDGISDSMVI